MEIFYYALTFISGLFFGSFLNLVSDRVVNGESILYGRSHCDNCKKNLGPKDLAPLLSFLLTKGKCRHCGNKLSYLYPLSEILSGILFVSAALYSRVFIINSGASWVGFLFLIVIFSFYLILFLTDLKYRLIPNKVVIPAIVFVLIYLIGNFAYESLNLYVKLQSTELGKYLIKAGFIQSQLIFSLRELGLTVVTTLLIAGFFLVLILVTKGRGMGGGDLTLGFLIGLVNGYPKNLIGIFLGFFMGALVSIVLVLMKHKTIKDTVPFGPFLIVGALIAYFWGEVLFKWYFGLF